MHTLKTRPRDVEETLLQLIYDDHPSPCGGSMSYASRKCGSLPTMSSTAPAHLHAKLPHVFELGASLTLAEPSGAPDTGRERARTARQWRADGYQSRIRASVCAALPTRFGRRNAAARDGSRTGENGRRGILPESAPPALWLLLTGEVVLESSTGQPAATARGGDIIGSIDTMAGRSLGRSAKVIREGVALRIDHEDLFNLLAERPDLLRQMFAGMFKRDTSQGLQHTSQSCTKLPWTSGSTKSSISSPQ